ncbi:hypothetical protein A1OE_183 [Candidatus Endolissoclinum faulkneri L2]|uniref:Glycosyltransferase RgtA/B/C/D-like domain-containing protein n=1 Tax=Candidatus Endolissoclinum faulkneri L2 TaxID=1193729 RepID=K7YFM4_9PROT|nr:glycosyltransferase family 39 protein [Candidatus Endolissoclinum faulkneri]AFX98385.1 hypothetical protein A1OE_183 [Candidatus Endolissoclinum faulkneri L2]
MISTIKLLFSKLTYLQTVLICVISLTALRLYANAFTDLELYEDEAQYWTWAQDLDLGYFAKPPLIAWLIAASTNTCGNGEACVRVLSPILHAGTALALFWLGKVVADNRVAMWSTIIWITLPSVGFSSLIFSTDVPLLFCWTLAIIFYRYLLNNRAWAFAIATGWSIGIGMLAQYDMVYIFFGIALQIILSPRDRWILFNLRGLMVILLTLLIIFPNIYWNATKHFPIIAHIGDDANLNNTPSQKFHVSYSFQFIIEQIGVFGPISFIIFAWRIILCIRARLTQEEQFLLSFAIPPLVISTIQAFLFQANAKWAITTYPTATILVALWLVSLSRRWVNYLLIIPHLFVSVALSIILASWPKIRISFIDQYFLRLTGWEQIAETSRLEIITNPDLPILMTDQISMSLLLYYMRDQLSISKSHPGKRAVYIWDWNQHPDNQYELIASYIPTAKNRMLILSTQEDISSILNYFDIKKNIRRISITRFGCTKKLRIWFVSKN